MKKQEIGFQKHVSSEKQESGLKKPFHSGRPVVQPCVIYNSSLSAIW